LITALLAADSSGLEVIHECNNSPDPVARLKESLRRGGVSYGHSQFSRRCRIRHAVSRRSCSEGAHRGTVIKLEPNVEVIASPMSAHGVSHDCDTLWLLPGCGYQVDGRNTTTVASGLPVLSRRDKVPIVYQDGPAESPGFDSFNDRGWFP